MEKSGGGSVRQGLGLESKGLPKGRIPKESWVGYLEFYPAREERIQIVHKIQIRAKEEINFKVNKWIKDYPLNDSFINLFSIYELGWDDCI